MRQQYRDWGVWGRHIIRSRHLGAYARAPDCNGICNGSQEPHFNYCIRYCWNYKVMGSQRSYLKGTIDGRDDADDEY